MEKKNSKKLSSQGIRTLRDWSVRGSNPALPGSSSIERKPEKLTNSSDLHAIVSEESRMSGLSHLLREVVSESDQDRNIPS